jgi:hypothetical protein
MLDCSGHCHRHHGKFPNRLWIPKYLNTKMILISAGMGLAQIDRRECFGVGRCGRIEETSLIPQTSEERRARPHMIRA